MSRGGVRTMEQRILAGNDFDGTMPSGPIIRGNGIEKYGPQDHGGVFDFELTAPCGVRSLELKLGGQSGWAVHKKDIEGDELLIMCGEDEASFITTESDTFVLTDKQQLIIRTTGAVAPLIARVTIQTYR